MNQHLRVKTELNRFIELKRRIAEAEPEIDERTLSDTVEGLTDLPEVLLAVIGSALEDNTMAAAIRGRIDALKERLVRIELRGSRKREIVRDVMEEAGFARLDGIDCTVSLRPSPPSLTVTDETLLPEEYWIPQPHKLDRRALLDAVKAGCVVSGAELSACTMTLAVRTR